MSAVVFEHGSRASLVEITGNIEVHHPIRNFWVCHECSTLVERPAGATGITLCPKHS